jgi:DNA polymerase
VEQTTLFSADFLRPTGPILSVLREQALICEGCKLRAGCGQVVFGEGQEKNPIVAFVGEAPGADEDAQGRPFVGRAGKLLDSMIAAMGLSRDQVYICNSVGCRPPENRKPEPDELAACRKFLIGQLRAVRPACIVTLGATATQSLLETKTGVTALMGRWYEWESIPLRPTFHPAYLLRDPTKKKEAWVDLKAVMTRVGLQAG